MSTTFFTNSVYGVGTRATITDNNGLYVADGATVGSTDDYAITAGGTNISLDIDGTLYGDLGGLIVTGSSSMAVNIGETGSIGGDISSGSAMKLTDFDGAVENYGLLKGSHAIEAFGQVDAEISNYGTIATADEAISLDQASTGTFQLINYGTISSDFGSSSIYESSGKTRDIILNVGVINGTLSLGNGEDVYFGASAKPSDSGLLSILFQFEGGFGKVASYVDGGAGNDTLYGSKFTDLFIGEKGKDEIRGGAGDDFLVGGAGADHFIGGKGKDRFSYQAAADSQGKAVDTIDDFSSKEKDQFDFANIDANTKKKDDQAFHFIGDNNFSGKAGELRFEFDHGNTIILGNTDTDKQAEFEIHLQGKIDLHQSDFNL